MLKWDGTDITPLISKSSVYEGKHLKTKYWLIHIPDSDKEKGFSETCIAKGSKNNIPCLIDELKPIFGLQKLGTHWCKHKGKYMILIRCVKTPDDHIKQELTLDKIDVRKNTSSDSSEGSRMGLLKLQIQEIFAFRELLGISCSFESSILIREYKNSIYPISQSEASMSFNDTKCRVPETMLNKWFEETNIDTVVARILKIHDLRYMTEVLNDIGTKIESVIERLDRTLIAYKDGIVSRITERLQSSLTLKT